MPTLDLTIANKVYRLEIKTGGESAARALASRVDGMMADLRRADPGMDRDTQLILTALQLAAELDGARQEHGETLTAVGLFHRALAERLETLTA